MSLAGLYELLLRGLAGEGDPNTRGYVSRENAHAELKQRTGQDFGYDPEKWRAYLRAHREELKISKFEWI